MKEEGGKEGRVRCTSVTPIQFLIDAFVPSSSSLTPDKF